MAFRTQKISQMTPKGANLEATDLIEVSTIESGSYVTRSITGQEIIDAAVGNVDWGDIGGTLSAQTDLQTALNAKQNTLSLTTTGSSGASTLVGATLNVPNYTLSGLGGVPTSRTLTINGVTQDLSADRTFTISTGITIGSTAIASGVVGRVLFEGAGNVVQESSSLTWDNTNARLGVGTSTPLTALELNSLRATISIRDTTGTTVPSYFGSYDDFLQMAVNRNPSTGVYNNAAKASAQISIEGSASSGKIYFFTTNTNNAIPAEAMRINGTGNVLIGTTTDTGYRLDINGTARVQNDVLLTTGILATSAGTTRLQSVLNFFSHNRLGSSGSFGWDIRTLGTQNSFWRYNTSSGNTEFGSNFYGLEFYGANTLRTTMTSGGNWLINTTTDAGYKLDVNGTARVKGTGTTSATTAFTIQNSAGANLLKMADDRSLFLGVFGSNNYVYFSDNGSGAAIKSDSYSMIFNTRSSGSVFRFTQGGNIDTASTIAELTNLNYSVNTPTLIGAIGTANASAQFEVVSTTKGFLPPRLTTTQKNAIASPAAGLMVYDTTLNVISYYNGSMWI